MTIDRIDPTPRRALGFTPMETRIAVIVEAAVTAERLGYEAVIVPEGWGLDAVTVLAAIANRTERIRLVAGVLSIWGRTPATTAMTAATLDDLSGGRFTLGLGTSTPTLAEQFHGVTYTAPADRLDGFVDEVRALLRGDRPARRHGRGLRLGQPARPDLPIWVAGLGPRARAIARDHADGWFPALIPRDRLDRTRRRLDDSQPSRAILACGPVAAATTGSFDGPDAARHLLGWYLTGMGPHYGDNVAAHGYSLEIAALRAANPRPSPIDIHWPAAADPLLEQLTVAGDPDAIAYQLARGTPSPTSSPSAWPPPPSTPSSPPSTLPPPPPHPDQPDSRRDHPARLRCLRTCVDINEDGESAYLRQRRSLRWVPDASSAPPCRSVRVRSSVKMPMSSSVGMQAATGDPILAPPIHSG